MRNLHARRIVLAILPTLLSSFAFITVASAQPLELPRPSPLAKVSQMVGLTEISVEYSSPAVKGRKIWGGLLPAGELWRTGANAATKITFSKDVTIADKPVPAGTYALFTIPTPTSWTVILNKNANQGGTDQYKQDLDQARFTVKPAISPQRERLTFVFADTSDSATMLDLEWEKVRIAIPIKAATDAQVAANIKNYEEGMWRPLNNAARHMLETKKDYDQGLKLVDKSLQIKEEWFNLWTKAQLLAAKGKAAEACPLAQKAKGLGDQNPSGFFFSNEVKKAITDWKCK
jgi:hypothetical protein